MPELPYLFVYGTLRSAAASEWSKFLAASSSFAGAGRARGALFQLHGGYPGMTVRASDHEWVTGDVFLLHNPDAALPSLDAYEGCAPGHAPPHEFERQVVSVELHGGPTIQAWAYVYAFDTRSLARIASGDYFRP